MSRPLIPQPSTSPTVPHKRTDAVEPAPAEVERSGRRRRVKRLAWRIKTVAEALDMSLRAIERERTAGRLPQPDLYIGKCPLWRPRTIRNWVERGGRP